MSQMTGKIIGTQLMSRILTILNQITVPLLKQSQIFSSKGIIAVAFANGSGQSDHVTTFFNGHLAFKGHTVKLTVQNGVAAHIMGRKVVGPNFTGRKAENGTQHSL